MAGLENPTERRSRPEREARAVFTWCVSVVSCHQWMLAGKTRLSIRHTSGQPLINIQIEMIVSSNSAEANSVEVGNLRASKYTENANQTIACLISCSVDDWEQLAASAKWTETNAIPNNWFFSSFRATLPHSIQIHWANRVENANSLSPQLFIPRHDNERRKCSYKL